jgi:VanZ family protein
MGERADTLRHPITRVRTLWLVATWLLVALVVYLSVTPRSPELPLHGGDKYGHFVAYGTLMLLFAQLYAGSRRWAAAAALVALGIALEFVQRWTGYRSFDPWDIAANTAGVLAGFVLAPPRLPNVLVRLERRFARRGGTS